MKTPLEIVADANITAVADIFSDLGRVHLVNGRDLSPPDVLHADLLLVRSVTPVDEALLSHSALRFVGSATSGVDHIDLDYLRRRQIGFSHAPGSNANSVVEYVLTAIAEQGDFLESLLEGGEVGILGYGRIGQLLAGRLNALGIGHRACDPWRTDRGLVDIDAVLNCSVVCVHAELTDRLPYPSRHLLGQGQLERLGGQQLLINAGRGAVVDNNALLERMAQPDPPTVVLDVWEDEPAIDRRLLDEVQLGTPHIAGYSHDGKLRATQMLKLAAEAQLGLVPRSSRDTRVDVAGVEVPAGPSTVAFFRALMRAAYDIGYDDRALRKALQETGAPGFDRLRKSYTIRRELFGRRWQGQPVNSDRRSILDALGIDYDWLDKA